MRRRATLLRLAAAVALALVAPSPVRAGSAATGFGELSALECGGAPDERATAQCTLGPATAPASGGAYDAAPSPRGVLGYAVAGGEGTAPLVELVDRRISAMSNARSAWLVAGAPDAERARAFLEPGPCRVALHVLRGPRGDIRLTTSEDDVARATGRLTIPPLLSAALTGGEGELRRYDDLGVAGYLLPYFEVGEPTATLRADGQPRGVILVIPGGGWQSDGERSVASEQTRAEVERWRARGWRTIAISFRSSREGPAELWPLAGIGLGRPVVPGSGRRSIEDVLWFHDRVREAYGDGIALCATGWSSGGHLALLLAERRPDVDCVVAEAAPTDLPALAGARTDAGRAAAFAFGEAAARERGNGLSPVDGAGALRAPVLLATAARDHWVPVAQMEAQREAMQRAGNPSEPTTLELAPGPIRFWHANVSEQALADFYAREAALAASVERCGDSRSPRRP